MIGTSTVSGQILSQHGGNLSHGEGVYFDSRAVATAQPGG